MDWSQGRALHWVVKAGDRSDTVRILTDVLGMSVLRHEEFSEGCEASCNGPYEGKWSKTMIGYGSEDTHFVVEVTYNYGLKSYDKGNDFAYILVRSSAVHRRCLEAGFEEGPGGYVSVRTGDGYEFRVERGDDSEDAGAGKGSSRDPVCECCLNVSDLGAAKAYWHGCLGLAVLSETGSEVTLAYGGGGDQCHLKLAKSADGGKIDHGTAFGRIAFALPDDKIEAVETFVKGRGFNILTPYVKLDTPGKASVHVVILTDPDGYEICFVGAEGFRLLSARDEAAEELLRQAMSEDKSAEYFANKGKE